MIDCQLKEIQGVKETLAMYCEKYGKTRIVSIEETHPELDKYEQIKLGDWG